jgi:hypothetical protein
MLITHPRANEIGINTDIPAFSFSNNDLFKAIAEEVDLETVTNHELREIFFIVRKQMQHLNWKDLVAHAVNHLPFGLNQTGVAWDGCMPCNGCPDAMFEGGSCYHEGECAAWEIYRASI